jgi:glutamate-1-semialdehyde 2,1-aminomutase
LKKNSEERLAEIAPTSSTTFEKAQHVLAGGMTHDIRYLKPFPIAIRQASGSRKQDADGNEFIDYVIGHGALLLGHSHPEIVEAVIRQVKKGTHFGAAHEIEVEWAELICRLIPSAERVRFTSSGTEAVMLASRAARAFTGRPTILKFHIHFHGWSEIGLVGLTEPFDRLPPGVPESVTRNVVALPPRDLDAVERRLAGGDVAAVILEPSGAHFGQVPLDPEFLTALRDATHRHGSLLIFDEVITGFRWAPGGAQERFGINPDLTTLAKILGGGLPAGALAGRADILELFELRGNPEWDQGHHLYHPGTFNGNPLSAAAGVAALKAIGSGNPSALAEKVTGELRTALNRVLEELGIPGVIYGDSSVFHIYLGPVPNTIEEKDLAFARMRGPLGIALRSALLARGVDLLVSGGMLSQAHGSDDVERTVDAFREAVTELTELALIEGV